MPSRKLAPPSSSSTSHASSPAKQDIGLLEQASQVLTQGLTTKTGICTYFKDITGIERQFFGLPFQVFGLDFVMGSKNYDLLQHIPDGRELAAGISGRPQYQDGDCGRTG